MSPSSIDPNSPAYSKLNDLATWLSESAEMKEQDNMLRCVDKDRYAKLYPLLKEMGFDKVKGHGYTMCRISGKTEIRETRGYRSLFFPLSVGSRNDDEASGEVQVAGELLLPGDYMTFTSPLALDAQLDCLIILLPDAGT